MEIGASLFPRHPRQLLTTLNSEAGDHLVCRESRELQAALRAGDRSRARFPYYERRYGERGRRFTRSDSAWLVALAEQEPAVIAEQITWLARVLAARGMPRWLLETHLEVLHVELISAVPGKAIVYASLRGAARLLRDERLRHLDESLFPAATSAFAARVGAEWDRHLPETGAMLVAAVADELAGVPRAVSSVVRWMTDPSLFPPRWIEAVTATIAGARARAKDAPRIVDVDHDDDDVAGA